MYVFGKGFSIEMHDTKIHGKLDIEHVVRFAKYPKNPVYIFIQASL